MKYQSINAELSSLGLTKNETDLMERLYVWQAQQMLERLKKDTEKGEKLLTRIGLPIHSYDERECGNADTPWILYCIRATGDWADTEDFKCAYETREEAVCAFLDTVFHRLPPSQFFQYALDTYYRGEK